MTNSKKPRRRNGFYYINDKEYPSVTKIIGDTIPKPALRYWLQQQAARIALKNPEMSEKEVLASVSLLSKHAAHRGTSVHKAVDIFFDTGHLPRLAPEYDGYLSAFTKWLESFSPKSIQGETEVYSDKYCYAGRFDHLVEINGLTWLLDFKTGKNIYKEVGLQLVAYQQALNELEIAWPQKLGVVLLMDSGEYMFKETSSTFNEFLMVRKLWDWVQKKEA